MPRKWAWTRCCGALIAAGASLVSSGCSESDPATGEDVVLSPGEMSAEVCAPVVGDGTVSYGLEPVFNVGDVDVELMAVHLEGADRVRLVEAYIAPEQVGAEFGVLTGWPGEGVSQSAQAALRKIPGAVVEPKESLGPANDDNGLVLRLSAEDGGSFQGVRIDYRREDEDTVRRSEPSHITFVAKKRCAGESAP